MTVVLSEVVSAYEHDVALDALADTLEEAKRLRDALDAIRQRTRALRSLSVLSGQESVTAERFQDEMVRLQRMATEAMEGT